MMKKIFNFQFFRQKRDLASTRRAIFKKSRGFTVVELLVAVGLFSTIASIAVGGFVRALRTQRQVAALISVNDNTFLAIEEMAREIRVGRLFCADMMNPDGTTSGTSSLCKNESEIAFISGFTNDTIQYQLKDGYIVKIVGGTPTNITGSGVLVRYLNFAKSGNGGLMNDGAQPRITISLGVTSRSSESAISTTRFQTTVSSRAPDG